MRNQQYYSPQQANSIGYQCYIMIKADEKQESKHLLHQVTI